MICNTQSCIKSTVRYHHAGTVRYHQAGDIIMHKLPKGGAVKAA